MFNLFTKVIKDNKRSLIGYGLGLLIYSLLMALLYPMFAKSGLNLEEYIKQFPEAFMKAFGVDATGKFTFTSYIGMEYLNLMWIIVVLFFIAYFAARMIAEGIEKGTIELLLARPISRLKIALTYILVFIIAILILEGATLLGFWLPSLWDKAIVVNWSAIVNTMTVLFFFSLAIFGYSFFFSAISSNKGKVVALSACLTLAFYIMNFVALYWEKISWLKHYTLFYYYRGGDILAGKPIVFTDVLVFGGVFVVFTLAGLWYFNRRDVCVK
ncbi:MAG: ABC transporter permease subunit [Patescibacteria group bacterium]